MCAPASHLDTLQEFLREDFNVQEHTNQVMQSMAIAEQLSKLAEGIGLLDKELHAQVGPAGGPTHLLVALMLCQQTLYMFTVGVHCLLV